MRSGQGYFLLVRRYDESNQVGIARAKSEVDGDLSYRVWPVSLVVLSTGSTQQSNERKDDEKVSTQTCLEICSRTYWQACSREERPVVKKCLQVKRGDNWLWVFCYNERDGVITTDRKAKALPARALETFEKKYANEIFRVGESLKE